MGLLANLKTLWKNKGKIKETSKQLDQIKGVYVKDGIKTTEFWITALTSANVIFESWKGNMDPKWAAIITAALALGFQIARSFAKSSASVAPKADPE